MKQSDIAMFCEVAVPELRRYVDDAIRSALAREIPREIARMVGERVLGGQTPSQPLSDVGAALADRLEALGPLAPAAASSTKRTPAHERATKPRGHYLNAPAKKSPVDLRGYSGRKSALPVVYLDRPPRRRGAV